MGDMADDVLDQLMDEDEAQLEALGHSIVFCQPRERLHIPKNCPVCKHLMIRRSGPFGPFMGCSNWPVCQKGPCISLTPPSCEPQLSEEDLNEMDRL
jgi:Topoisomerase DNA binding C4 zinc finger